MQRVIENFPEFKKGERNTTKHFTILEELRRNVDKNHLYEVSELEQEIATGAESRTKHLKGITDLLENDKLNKKEGLRLLLLYSLRYENDEKVRQLKVQLQPLLGDDKIKSIDCLLEYAGKAKRKGDLFKD